MLAIAPGPNGFCTAKVQALPNLFPAVIRSPPPFIKKCWYPSLAVSEELINEEIIKQKIEEAQIIPKYREMALSVTRGILEDQDSIRAEEKQAAQQLLDLGPVNYGASEERVQLEKILKDKITELGGKRHDINKEYGIFN